MNLPNQTKKDYEKDNELLRSYVFKPYWLAKCILEVRLFLDKFLLFNK